MARAGRAVCAFVALVVLGGGCSGTGHLSRYLFLLSNDPNAPEDRIVVGSVETVAESTAATLQHLGIDTEMTKQGQALRIACTTKHGGRFYLLLTRVESPEGDRTRIHLDWEGSFDRETGFHVLTQLEAESGK